MRFRSRLLGSFLLLTATLLAQTPSRIRLGGRDVAYWKPLNAQGNAPVILFSHGYGGCNTQSKFLMQALAEAGYLVLAPNHADARCGSAWGTEERSRPQEPFKNAKRWSDGTYRDRADDMKSVLDAVLAKDTFDNVKINRKRIGLAGHSLGGYTVLGIAGGWPEWKDSRVGAVLALSPYSEPYVDNGDLGGMKIPVMYQGGTRDLGITPTVRKSQGAYDKSSSPKYYVEFEGAGHFAWTDLNPRFQPVIDQYSVAFFDRYLKDDKGTGLDRLFAEPLPKGVSSAISASK